MYLLFIQNEESTSKSEIRPLFNFNDVQAGFESILKKWFLKSENLAPIKNHLLDAILIKRVFKSVDFLVIVFALEGYFLRFRDKNSSFTNAVSVLLKEFSDIQFMQDNNINVKEVKDSRDYYAHLFDIDKKPDTLFGQDLYKLAEKLKLLLVCSVLKQIGFDNLLIEKCVRQSGLKYHFKQIPSQIAFKVNKENSKKK